MTLYLLKSTIILGILLAVYHLFMEREKMHRFNRFYLLSGLVLAFFTPLITIGTIDPIATTSFIATAPTVINEVQHDIIYETPKGVEWTRLLIGGYALITFLLLLRFINNLANLLITTTRHTVIPANDYKIVLIDDITLPHTFMKYVFMNKAEYESGDIEPELFIHESTHGSAITLSRYHLDRINTSILLVQPFDSDL